MLPRINISLVTATFTLQSLSWNKAHTFTFKCGKIPLSPAVVCDLRLIRQLFTGADPGFDERGGSIKENCAAKPRKIFLKKNIAKTMEYNPYMGTKGGGVQPLSPLCRSAPDRRQGEYLVQ